MNHIGLFEGFGGFSLAIEQMGWKTKAWCEWNPFCQTVLRHHFPDAEGFSDITKTDFTKYEGLIDIVTGGFPCQPFSTAGKRKGTDDARYLWPEMLRALREIRPRWVIGENVYGLVNWDNGVVFDTVCADLENEGFEVWPVVLPACGVNAPHRRDRIFFIAYADNPGRRKSDEEAAFGFSEQLDGDSIQRNDPDTDGHGLQRRRQPGNGKAAEGQVIQFHAPVERNHWQNFPLEPPLCGGNDGFSLRLDGITFPKWRNESIKGYGNAVVPPLVLQILKTIDLFETVNDLVG